MKKNIVAIGIVLVVVSLLAVFYNQVIAKSFRYDTPAESFFHSREWGDTLVHVLEEKDVAMVISCNREGENASYIIAKDNRGWEPLSVTYSNKREVPLENGVAQIKDVQGKNVVRAVVITQADATLVISDSMNSAFSTYQHTSKSGMKIWYALLVLEQELPEDYEVKIEQKQKA